MRGRRGSPGCRSHHCHALSGFATRAAGRSDRNHRGRPEEKRQLEPARDPRAVRPGPHPRQQRHAEPAGRPPRLRHHRRPEHPDPGRRPAHFRKRADLGAVERHCARVHRADRNRARQARTPGDKSDRQNGTLTLGGAWNVDRHDLAADLSYRNKNASALFLPSFFHTNVNVWSFAPRAKLRFDAFGRTHDVTLGADWERWDYDNRNTASGEQTNQALYAQANLWAAERTRLVLGGRVQRSEERLTELLLPPDERRASHTLEAYDAALRQGFGAGWSGYAKYGTSFRLANFDENACFGPPCAATLLDPQKARTAELGAEYERGGWRGRVALYETRLENEIYFSPAVFANINLPPTQRRGAELEGSWRATPALEWRGSLALLEAKFRATGKDVPLVPDAIATAGMSWSFAARSRLNLNAHYVGRQRYANDQDNVFARRMPAYGLLDAKLEHRIDRVNVALEARNLFDKKYYSYGLWDGANSFVAYPQPGRAVYLSLAYRLD